MKKAVYNSKKEQTKSRRKLGEKTRKEISGRKFQEENFREKISGRKFQEENFREKITKGIGNVWIWIFLM